MITLAKKWGTFVKERFDPLTTALMIAVFVGAHLQVSGGIRGGVSGQTFAPSTAVLFLGVLTFFFKLRLYDEIKDFELDCTINPTRPLPRGLLSIPQVQVGILICIVIELLCFAFQGWAAFSSMVAVLAYSLVMYNEFFLRTFLRPQLTTYALLHTASCGLLSMALLSFLGQTPLWELPSQALLFALASWCVFNVFEFGRKTFAHEEERQNVESYSLVWGRFGAVALVAFMIGTAGYSLTHIQVLNHQGFQIACGAIFMSVVFSGIVFAVSNTVKTAKVYRTVCSLSIVLTFLAVMLLSRAY